MNPPTTVNQPRAGFRASHRLRQREQQRHVQLCLPSAALPPPDALPGRGNLIKIRSRPIPSPRKRNELVRLFDILRCEREIASVSVETRPAQSLNLRPERHSRSSTICPINAFPLAPDFSFGIACRQLL